MLDYLFEKRFVYLDRTPKRSEVRSTSSKKEVCIPQDKASLIDKLFRSSKICKKPEETKSKDIGDAARDLINKQIAYKEKHGKEMSRGRSGYEFLKSLGDK